MPKFKVRENYAFYKGTKVYKSGEIVELSDKTVGGQAWKLDDIEGEKVSKKEEPVEQPAEPVTEEVVEVTEEVVEEKPKKKKKKARKDRGE